MSIIQTRTGHRRSLAARMYRAFKRDRYLYLIMLLPAAYYLLFCYYPMYGVTLAFKNFKPKLGILHSPWASQNGMKYMRMIVEDSYFWLVFKNTITLNLINLCITFPAPIILALLLNELGSQRYKKLVQTVTYLPHFLSVVVVVGMMSDMFNSTGIVNSALKALGFNTVPFLTSASAFRPMYIGSNLWQNVGWESIIFLAALSGLDMELYEAARIDGAGRWKQTLHVTIPGILPTIIIDHHYHAHSGDGPHHERFLPEDFADDERRQPVRRGRHFYLCISPRNSGRRLQLRHGRKPVPVARFAPVCNRNEHDFAQVL